MESDERAVRETHATWINAVNAGDLNRLLTMLADDAVLIGPGQAPFRRNEFPAFFSAALKQSRFICTSDLEEVVVVGEFAYTRARDSLSMTPLTGDGPAVAMQFAGHRLTVYRKHAGGRWLLARDAHTLLPVEKSKP
jgi:uncharacterized protein (TIGR02246 family)